MIFLILEPYFVYDLMHYIGGCDLVRYGAIRVHDLQDIVIIRATVAGIHNEVTRVIDAYTSHDAGLTYEITNAGRRCGWCADGTSDGDICIPSKSCRYGGTGKCHYQATARLPGGKYLPYRRHTTQRAV